MRLSTAVCVTLVATLSGPTADAVTGRTEQDARWVRWSTSNETAQRQLGQRDTAWQELVDEHGRSWRARWNERNGTLNLAWGGGIELADADADGRALERAARQFVERRRSLFRIGNDALSPVGPITLSDGGRLATVGYVQRHGGLDVLGSNVFLQLRSGRLVRFGSRVFPDVRVNVEPTISAARATRLAGRDLTEQGSTATLKGTPQTAILPIPRAGSDGFDYRLVYVVRMSGEAPEDRWRYVVDAHDGQLVRRSSEIYHTADGEVLGLLRPRLRDDPPELRPLPYVTVTVGGSQTDSDGSGAYSSDISDDPVQRRAELLGPYFQIENLGGSEALFDTTGAGTVDVVFDGSNSRLDETTTYYHAARARELALPWLDLGWLDRRLIANVNLSSSCNAFWDGTTINFYREGGGCANTGEIADVVAHEWGHGLDANDGNGIRDSGFSEGFADTVALLLTGDCLMAPGFFDNGAPVRDNCSPCHVDDCRSRFDPHRTGQVYASAMVCVRDELLRDDTEAEVQTTMERLTFLALPGVFNLDDTFSATLVADDDDGDLSNGTPNECAIQTCFAGVGLATVPECAGGTFQPSLECAGGPYAPGDTVEAEIVLTNATDFSQTNVAELAVGLPDGTEVVRTQREVELDSGAQLDATYRQRIPATATSGTYALRLRTVVDGEIDHEAACTFDVLGP